MRIRTKICGLTRTPDAQVAWNLGVDALGMIFHADSPRCVTLQAAIEISANAPPFVTRVGVFVNPQRAEVEDVLERVELDLLQFHGEETGSFCASFGRPFIKALRPGDQRKLQQEEQEYHSARALLLDSATGGSGRAFDWKLWPQACSLPLILAGGLSPDNVAAAIRATAPFAVDVSSGVESTSSASPPGKKDPLKIAAFLSEVHRINERAG